MTWSTVLTAFVLVAPIELPDKTMFSTLVLASRFRPLPVLLGVSTAFGVQAVIAIAAGSLLSLLPRQWVALGVSILFSVGAVLLWRAADEFPDGAEEHGDATLHKDWSAQRIATASFVITFVAEWGDLSQLAMAGLAARYDAPVSVFLGSFGALFLIAALAVFVGNKLVARLPFHLVRRAAAVLFAGFSIFAAYEAITAFTE